MRRIAGLSDDKDGNFWESSFEGTNPLAVELSNPHDCGTDALGRVFIVDKNSHSVLVVSADGQTIRTAAGTHHQGNGGDSSRNALNVDLDEPNGLHVFADGSFLILDTENQKVRRVSQGVCETLFSYPAGFADGRGLVATPDGEIVYFCGESLGSSQRVKKWTQGDGFSTVAIVPTGSDNLGNIALSPDGSLIVTSEGSHRVYRVNEGVLPIVIAGNGSTSGSAFSGSLATSVSLEQVRGVAVLPDGTYFLAAQKGGDIWWVDGTDPVTARIHLFVNGQRNENWLALEGSFRVGASPRISEPRAIHLASNGDLLITSNDNGVIFAVTNTCPPSPPLLDIQGQELQWQADWQESVLLESTTDPSLNDWELELGVQASSFGQQSHSFTRVESKKFWRLRTTRQAGGQVGE